MSSWMKSRFSEGITMELGLWEPEARGLRIRVIRGCRRPKGMANFQNLVPIPRNTRDATNSRIGVPAPKVMIMDFMINYRGE